MIYKHAAINKSQASNACTHGQVMVQNSKDNSQPVRSSDDDDDDNDDDDDVDDNGDDDNDNNVSTLSF